MRDKQRVLILGGTGSVGGAIAQVLRQRDHKVTCLSRSRRSDEKLRPAGVKIRRGDIRDPNQWVDCADEYDAVVHAAITWSEDMAEVDQRLTKALLAAFATPNSEKALIYTDGCWAYGNTADKIATEETPYDPLPAFAWSLDMARQVRENRNVRGMVVFPAMVYERDGGVLEPLVEDARRKKMIRIVGSENVRWPLVHRVDLAHLYASVLELGEHGSSFNGAGIESMEIGRIARTLAKRHGAPPEPVILPVAQAVQELGNWAEGYGLDQQMSSAKAKKVLGWSPKHTDILAELS